MKASLQHTTSTAQKKNC